MNLNQQHVTNGVNPRKRFTRKNPCPVCGGGNDDERGKSTRCCGYYGCDGRWHCTREEFAGELQPTNADPPTYAHAPTGKCGCGEVHGEAEAENNSATRKIVDRYGYKNADGTLAYRVVRTEPKGFYQEAPDGTKRTKGIPRILFRLPQLIAADPSKPVHVAEGEKDVKALRKLGFVATCNPGGAGKWRHVEALAREVLAGRDVVVVADADEPGRKHAADVAASLRGYAKSVRVVEAPAPHKDVSDLLDAGGTINELVDRGATTTTFRPLKDQIASLGERRVRIATGFDTFDTAMRGGPVVGRVIIAGGPPAGCKTGFVTNIAHGYVTKGHHVAFMATDEEANGILTRLGQLEGLDRLDLENGDPDARATFIERSSSWPLLLVQDENTTIEAVADELLARAAGAPAVLIVDSVQRARTATKTEEEGPRARVNAVIAALKSAARRGLLVFATCELARGGYRSRNAHERIDDLAAFKESGDIEYGADVALVMRSVAGTNDLFEVTIAKNRLGPRTPFRLSLDSHSAQLREVEMPGEGSTNDGGELERFRRIDEKIVRVLTETTNPLTSRRMVFLAAKDMGIAGRETDFYARLKAMVDTGSVLPDVAGWRLAATDGASREEGGK